MISGTGSERATSKINKSHHEFFEKAKKMSKKEIWMQKLLFVRRLRKLLKARF